MQISVKIYMSNLTPANIIKAFLVYYDLFGIILEVLRSKQNEKILISFRATIFCFIKFWNNKVFLQPLPKL